MNRASNSFSLLQATAATLGLAMLLWSFGLPSLRFAEAANVTSFSDTLSDSAPSVVANHTIQFVTPTGLAAGEIISLTFPAGFTGIGALTAEDLDLKVNGVDQDLDDNPASGAIWNVTAAGQVIDIESGTDTVGPGETVIIEIGLNASYASTSDSQITNPAGLTSYEIGLTLSNSDTGKTRVAIVDSVTVTASVDTLFTFTVNGVAAGTLVNTADSTGGDTTATAIPFGVLDADTASTAAQNIEVSTNAANGFVVTVETDHQLLSANGADIDGFRNGSYDASPVAWESPGATPGQENEYGHWGISSNDTTLTGGLSDFFSGGDNFVSASTTPVEVFRHDGPTDGTVAGEGNADIIYMVETTALQEAAEDYTATLTYVATPVF
ncbi:hypothetical protein H6784_00500 [Candidatus Nomurabacteria bacterium]|nr:hypothetical protein [Candidatus Nomurabacteria bacterium]